MTSDAGAKLEVVAGKAAGQSLFVTDELIIGRLAEEPGQLGGDEEISRSHARVAVDASGAWAIEDLGSTNGTYVNGLRISAPQTLSEGDTIELGGTTVVVQELPRAAGRAVTAPRSVPPPPPTPAPPPTPPQEPPSAPPPLAETEALVPPPGVPAPEPPPEPEVAAPPPEPEAPAPPSEPEAPAPPPEPEAPAPPPEPLPPLVLSVEIDVEAREAVLTVGGSETVRLRFEAGRWQVAGSH